MSDQTKPTASIRPVGGFTRRDLLGFAARGAAAVAITQGLLACADGAIAGVGEGTDTTGTTGSTTGTTGSTTTGTPSCIVTADLTEGPYFVDEKLLRSDIRSDPASGQVSSGVPLRLQFNVQRVAASGCTPLTGAFLDVWHCDSAGAY